MSTRRRVSPWLIALLALLPAAWGCQAPPSSSSSESPAEASDSEAERTRRMQELAAEIEREAEEIRTMEGTDQEKIDAVNRLEEKRQELNEMQQGDED